MIPVSDANMISSASAKTQCKFPHENPVDLCVHIGPSMNPTLRDLDLLEIVPYFNRDAKNGEVIFFVPPQGSQAVVHRIVKVTPRGVRTRGDNNTNQDPWLLPFADIGGQVVASWRGQKRHKVRGRKSALLTTWTISSIWFLKGAASHMVRPIYRSLARSGIISRLLPPRFRPRVVLYQANGHQRVRLLLGRHVVGQYDDHRCQWHVKPPLRPLVDSSILACPPKGRLGDSSNV